MTNRPQIQSLIEARESVWVPRGLMGPTSDELRAACAASGWDFVQLNLRGAGDREALMDALSSQLSLPDYFGRNWDALDECLGDAWEGRKGVVIRLKHLRDVAETDAHVLVDILNARMTAASPPVIVVSDPPLPEVSW